jgi:hypothetical protein
VASTGIWGRGVSLTFLGVGLNDIPLCNGMSGIRVGYEKIIKNSKKKLNYEYGSKRV